MMQNAAADTQKLMSIQAIRAVAALFILLIHTAMSINAGGSSYDGWFLIFSRIGFFGVDIFFVVSGLVMVLTSHQYIGKPGSTKKFLIKRIFRIYSSYWIVLIALFALLSTGLLTIWRTDPIVSSSILLAPLPQKQQMLPVAWTLAFEVFFYLMFALAMLCGKRLFLPFLLTWASIVIICNIFFIDRSQPQEFVPLYIFFYLSPLQLEFIGGCLVGLLVKNRYFPLPLKSPWLIVGILLLFILVNLTSWFSNWGNWHGEFPRTIFYGTLSVILVYVAAQLEITKNLRFPALLNRIGDASYSLYLIHPIIILLSVEHIYTPLLSPLESPLVDNVFIGSLLATIIIYSLIHYRFIERPVLRLLTKIITSPKSKKTSSLSS